MDPFQENIHTVTSLTELVRTTLTRAIPYVWVRGEITNFNRAASGHIYFAVKDPSAQLQCVWFAGRQKAGKFDPLTGEVFDTPRPSPAQSLQNGLEILCSGSMEVYASRGQYQLIIDQIIPTGSGFLALEFEKRKKKLADAGYFASARKRQCPTNPLRIALITSPHGAAIHDFIELADKRGSGSVIRLFPVQVQGQGAAEKMADAICEINKSDWPQIIVLVRGGGSLEDLWAFNEEVLATAIFQSRLPVLAGIGHEVDFTLADMTADLRAATPSHAAQLLWPLRSELWQRLDQLQINLDRSLEISLHAATRELQRLTSLLQLLSPAKKLARDERELHLARARLKREMLHFLDVKTGEYRLVSRQLPGREQMLSSIADRGEKCALLMEAVQVGTENLQRRLEARASALATALSALDPARPLTRGYAILYDQKGHLPKFDAIQPGQQLVAYMDAGKLTLGVEQKQPDAIPPFQLENGD